MAMRAVDLDLFVNSASKGFNDGAKVPSPFAAFVESYAKGMDAQQDYENKALDMERKQIEIDRSPIDTRIKEAQAIRAEADAAVITENPELYKSSQVADLEARAADRERAAIVQRQKTELLEIQKGDDPVAKSNAANSQQFADLYAQDPKIKEQFIKTTYADWDEEGQKLYQETKSIERQREWDAEMTETVYKNFPKAQEEMLGDPSIQTIMNKIGNNVNPVDLMEKGKIVPVYGAKSIPKMIEDPTTKKMVPALDEFNNPIYIPDPSGFGTPEKRLVFQYEGQQYEMPGGITSETNKIFNNAKTGFQMKNRLMKNQDGPTDLSIAATQKKEIKARNNAQAVMDYEKNSAEIQSKQDAFFAGTKIAGPYQEAANRVREGINESRGIKPDTSDAAGVRAAPTPALIPDMTIRPDQVATGSNVVNWDFVDVTAPASAAPSGRPASGVPGARTNEPNRPTPGAAPAPAFTVSTGTAAPTVMAPPGAAPAADVKPPVTEQDKQNQLKQQIIKSKAEQFASKYQKTNSPTPQAPTPVNQARQAVASSFIAPKMQINVSTEYRSIPGIERVRSDPNLQGLSAITKALIVQESRGFSAAVSRTGVRGIAQVTEGAANDISPGIDRIDPLNSAMLGAIFIEKLMMSRTFGDNPMLAVTSYNVGPKFVATAIKLAGGSTDWNKVKEFIGPAVLSDRKYWTDKGIKPEQKAIEAREFAERVVANFPDFIHTRRDESLANKLKQQKVLSF